MVVWATCYMRLVLLVGLANFSITCGRGYLVNASNASSINKVWVTTWVFEPYMRHDGPCGHRAMIGS